MTLARWAHNVRNAGAPHGTQVIREGDAWRVGPDRPQVRQGRLGQGVPIHGAGRLHPTASPPPLPRAPRVVQSRFRRRGRSHRFRSPSGRSKPITARSFRSPSCSPWSAAASAIGTSGRAARNRTARWNTATALTTTSSGAEGASRHSMLSFRHSLFPARLPGPDPSIRP